MKQGEEQYTACPHCTMQIPADLRVCPHCQQLLSAAGDRTPGAKRGTSFRDVLRSPRDLSLWALWERYGKWIMVAGPVLAAFALLFLVYGTWVGYTVRVEPNPALPVTVKQEKRNDAVVIRATVENLGEDVPDLSLKSIGVVVEFVYRDGRREKKTVFPKSEYRGEGALLRGESGTFEIEAPARGLKEVTLRSEIVDLGMGRTLVAPGGGWRPVPRRP